MRNVVIASPVQTQSGYGHHAREIISNLIELKSAEWDIKLISLPWGHTPMTYPIAEEWKQRIIPPQMQQQPDIWIQVTVPNEFKPIGKYNIGVTAATEGDVAPAEWIDSINAFQLVIVPSQFTKTVIENTATQHQKSVTTEIQVIPEYFDSTYYDNTKPLIEIPEIDAIDESFVFLFTGHWLQGDISHDRKDITGLIHTFFDTFKNTKNAPALLLKTSGATYSVLDRHDIQEKILQIRRLFSKAKSLPNIYVLHGDLTDDEMNSMYNHPKVKAMVSFTKAEGFGRPLLEFTTTGKPLIAPHYSGPADFLKKEFICELPGTLRSTHATAHNQFVIPGSKWFYVDYAYAGRMMQDVMKNYKKWTELGKRQRYFSVNNFSREAVHEQYKQLVEVIDKATESIPVMTQLTLPKLSLPKLKKV